MLNPNRVRPGVNDVSQKFVKYFNPVLKGFEDFNSLL